MNPVDVQNIQKALNLKGAKLKVDGLWGPVTDAAFKKLGAGLVKPGTSTPAAAPTAAAISDNDKAQLRSEYGFLAAYLDDPEIGPLLKTATDQGYTAARLQQELLPTNWWKTTQASARQWDAKVKLDPETANDTRRKKSADIWDTTIALGLDLSPSQRQQLVGRMSEEAIKYDWSDRQLRDAVVSEIDFTKSLTGESGTTGGNLKKIAAQYLIPVSDQTISQWTRQILSQEVDENAFTSWAKEQAKSLFPNLSGAIDAGVTVAQYTEPYKQVAAQMLGLSPDSIDMRDTKWSKALQQIDPKTGNRVAMTLSEWEQNLRKDPVYGYTNTNKYKEEASSLSGDILRKFGATT